MFQGSLFLFPYKKNIEKLLVFSVRNGNQEQGSHNKYSEYHLFFIPRDFSTLIQTVYTSAG